MARAVEAEVLAEALAEVRAERLALVADGPAALLPPPDGLAPALVRMEPVPVGLAPVGLAPPWLAPPWLAVACERGGAGLAAPVAPVVVAGWVGRSAGAVEGLNVATESIAPATRHTARMLASSGMTVPGPENGPVSRRSRFLRRCARSSRW
jgi:hypothetical protein